MGRLLLVGVVAVCLLTITLVIPPAFGAEPGLEPGLTSRVASLALARYPQSSRPAIAVLEREVIERLQSPPALSSDDHAAQLKLVLETARANGATAALVASAARAVVALTLPDGENQPAWTSFRSGLALRSVLEDVDLGTVPSVTDSVAFAAQMRGAGEAVRAEALAAVQSGDAAKILQCRRKAVSLATRGVVAVWMALLPDSPAPAQPVAEAKPAAPAGLEATPPAAEEPPPAEVPAEQQVSAEQTVPAPAPAPVITGFPRTNRVPVRPLAAVRVIGNKVSLKFHRTDCRYLPAPANQVPLASRDEALRRGFQPCRICKP